MFLLDLIVRTGEEKQKPQPAHLMHFNITKARTRMNKNRSDSCDARQSYLSPLPRTSEIHE
jgi:hypothetical protein